MLKRSQFAGDKNERRPCAHCLLIRRVILLPLIMLTLFSVAVALSNDHLSSFNSLADVITLANANKAMLVCLVGIVLVKFAHYRFGGRAK